MCLIINPSQRAKKAKEDIVCYKILRSSKESYRTYYMGFTVKMGETYTSNIIRSNSCTINEGLHSFAKMITKWQVAPKATKYIAKCIIPKGSWYYIGKFGRKISYASDTLKYIEIIKTFK